MMYQLLVLIIVSMLLTPTQNPANGSCIDPVQSAEIGGEDRHRNHHHDRSRLDLLEGRPRYAARFGADIFKKRLGLLRPGADAAECLCSTGAHAAALRFFGALAFFVLLVLHLR